MATLSNFGIPGAGFGHLAPKKKHWWRVTFQGLGRAVPGAENLSRDITRQLISFQRPQYAQSEHPMHRYNQISYYTGKHEFQPTSFVVEDDITGLASTAIQAQLETQQRVIGIDLPGNWLNGGTTGSDHKFGTLCENLDGNEGVLERWYLEGCFFTQVTYGQLDYSMSDAITIDVTMRFDHARQELLGNGYGTNLGGIVTSA